MPLRWYHDRFTIAGRRLRIPVTRGRPPLWVRLDRDLPYPPEQIRSVTLLYDAGRLWVDVTAEVPVACYPADREPDPDRVAGWIWASSTRMRWPGRMARGCWYRGGRSAPSTGCTWPTARLAPGRWPAARPSPGIRGRGGGGISGAASGWRRPGTGGGSARPSTRPPRLSSPGRWPAGSAPWPSATRAVSCSWTRADGITSAPATADRSPDRCAGRQGRGRRAQPAGNRRAGHLLHLPGLPVPGSQTCRADAGLPGLPVHRPPRPFRGGQHRRPRGRRDYAGHSPGRRDAPPRRGTPAWCSPLAT
jgi:hypothetical protein